MFVTMLGAVYGLLRWIQTDDHDQLHHCTCSGGLRATVRLTRYEGWTSPWSSAAWSCTAH